MNKKILLLKKYNNSIKNVNTKNINLILNFIDKIYIINLDERKDRYKKCLSQLNNYNITNFQRFSAIKPIFEDINPIIYKNYSSYLSHDKKKYIVGATGCKFSHRNIIKDAFEKNYENVLILEDDFLFSGNFAINLYYYIKKVKNINWDMLYLGGNNKSQSIDKYCIQTNMNKIYKCKDVKCTHAYIINKRLFPKILKDLETYSKEIDNYYFECIQPYYNTYIYDPILVKQVESFSDIVQKNVKNF